MNLHRNIDDWFLGYKTRAVHPKENPIYLKSGSRKGLKTGFGLRNLTAAAKRHPEVMVKIPKRFSQNSKGLHGIRNHLDYISRNGEVTVETNTGEKLTNKQQIKAHLTKLKNLGITEESPHREAINIVLSMPAGTNPDKVLNAARAFAAERFAHHQYALALHHESEREGEPPHPHVHLSVLVRDNMGNRINPRKNDLFEWRVHFAERLRDEGVQCAATQRKHRGKTQKAESGVVRAIKQRGVEPEIVKSWQQELTAAIQENRSPNAPFAYKQAQPEHYRHELEAWEHEIRQAQQTGRALIHPFQQKADNTRQKISQEYAQIARALYQQGYKTEARLMSKLKQQLDAQSMETQAEQHYRSLKSDMDKANQATAISLASQTTFRQPENEHSGFRQSQNEQNPQTQPIQSPSRRIPSTYPSSKPQTESEQDTDMEY